MQEHEVHRVIKLVARLNLAFDGLMPKIEERPLWNTAAHLIVSDYSGQVVTITSLASITGLPYATSRRFIQSLIGQGLIIRSARSSSGKTYSLHPSDQLREAFDRYAKEVKAILADVVGARSSDVDESEYYLGAPRAPDYIPPLGLIKIGDPQLKLRFLLNDDRYFSALRNLWTDFRSNLGSRSNFTLKNCPNTHTELVENSRRAVSAYDIVSVNLPWLGELVEGGVLQPIADLLDHARYASSAADADVKTLGTWKGQTYGVPIYCNVELFAARSDLFEEAALKYPSSFDDVIAAGRRLMSTGRVRYGVVWDAAPGMPIATSFMTLLAAGGTSALSARMSYNALAPSNLAEEELADVITGEAGRRTLAYMHQLIEISPPAILDVAWDEALDSFMSGATAMCYSWSMRMGRVEYEPRSVIKRRVKYLTQPVAFGGTRASPLNGFLLAVPKNVPPDRARLAVETIGWLISADSTGSRARNELPAAPRFAVAVAPEMKASSCVVSFIQDLARKGLLHTQHRPATPRYSRIETILGEEVHAAMTHDKSDRQALISAASRIARLAELRPTSGRRPYAPSVPLEPINPAIAGN